MYRKIVLTTLLFLSVMMVVAQSNQKRLTKEDIFNRKWEFVKSKANLTPADAEKVHPLFIEVEEQIWQLFAGNRQIFRSKRSNNAEKVNFEAMNDAIIETEVTKANLQKSYYLKLKRVIDAETINKLFHAEKSYQRDLMQNMKEGLWQGKPGHGR